MTPCDVVHCVTLCALATLDRDQLSNSVLNDPVFRQFIEAGGEAASSLEAGCSPSTSTECNNCLVAFHAADYATALACLERLYGRLRLDYFLSDHVDTLYERIRVRALCQYFLPFATADLRLMADVFRTTVGDLENELAELIRKGTIKARIDSEKQVGHLLGFCSLALVDIPS